MLAKYEDILKRIKEEPVWFDTNGVPRYDKFHPELSPNIYAEEVVLLKIRCQNCHKEFLVEMNWCMMDKVRNEFSKSLKEWIKKKGIHYGDPPRHDHEDGSRCAGETMNCDDIGVVEFWKQDKKNLWNWKRNKRFEIRLLKE